MLCNDPAREAEWDAWYDEQHVPDMLSCGAFSAMSRWQRTPRAQVGSNFLTLYDVATDTVDEAVQRSAVTLAEIVAAGRKHESHTGALTVTLRTGGPLRRLGLPARIGVDPGIPGHSVAGFLPMMGASATTTTGEVSWTGSSSWS